MDTKHFPLAPGSVCSPKLGYGLHFKGAQAPLANSYQQAATSKPPKGSSALVLPGAVPARAGCGVSGGTRGMAVRGQAAGEVLV